MPTSSFQAFPIVAPSAEVSVANHSFEAALSLSSPDFQSLKACSLSYWQCDKSVDGAEEMRRKRRKAARAREADEGNRVRWSKTRS